MTRIGREGGTTVFACVVVALFCGVAPLVGRATGASWLVGFGSVDFVAQPSASAALIALALALRETIHGRRWTAAALLLAPVGIAVAALFQRVFGLADAPAALAALGRPSLMSAVALLLLALAIASAAAADERWRRVAAGASVAALLLGLVAIVGVPLGRPAPGSVLDVLELCCLPAAVGYVALSLALLVWRADEQRPDASERRLIRTVALFTVVTPIVTELIQDRVERSGLTSGPASDLLETGLHILAMAGLLLWASRRIARQNRAQSALVRALDAAPIALTDMHGTVLHWSEGCEQLYGWTAAEAQGQPKHRLLRSASATDLADRLATTTRWEGEIVENTRDGAALHILEQARKLEPRHGGEPIVVLSMTDISARVHAESALARSEERLSIAIDAHEISITEWDAATGAFRWSPEGERRLGIEPGTVRDLKTWSKFLEPGEAARAFKVAADAAAAGEPGYRFRVRVRSPSGAVRTIEGSTALLYNTDGSVASAITAHSDVTEREEREAALKAREAQLRSVLETVPDAMIVSDDDDVIRSFSAAAERMFGYASGEVVGQRIDMLMPPHRGGPRDNVLKHDVDRAHPRLVGRTSRLVGLHRSGRELPIDVTVGEAVAGGERLFTSFVRDLTEPLAVKARLAELQAELMHVSRLSAMGEVAAGLAHELNQPLTAAVNNLTAAGVLLANDGGDAQVGALIERARTQALGTGAVIRRLRGFVERGEVQMLAEPVAETVADAIAIATTGLANNDVRVRTTLDPDCPAILVDRVQVQQVLLNLLRNAIEAMADCPRDRRQIVVASRGDGAMVEFSVCDSGPGLSAAALDKLFTPFASTKANGMGVGLSICRRIVEAHGGTLTAGNGEDGGAILRFTLRRAGTMATVPA